MAEFLVDNAVDGNDTVVSIGETTAATREPEDDDVFSATDDDEEEDPTTGRRTRPGEEATMFRNNEGLLFYDENLDEEDEAYVYEHMRGGVQQEQEQQNRTADAKRKKSGRSRTAGSPGEAVFDDDQQQRGTADQDRNPVTTTTGVLKPRHSDAVLSCPCCFNIVCMDCQKHRRYANQYRAMFVMGIRVDWNHVLVYDRTHRGLVSREEVQEDPTVEDDDDDHDHGEQHGDHTLRAAKKGEFYAVECASCGTQVAALDMTEEVYHFSGCLESSSAF